MGQVYTRFHVPPQRVGFLRHFGLPISAIWLIKGERNNGLNKSLLPLRTFPEKLHRLNPQKRHVGHVGEKYPALQLAAGVETGRG